MDWLQTHVHTLYEWTTNYLFSWSTSTQLLVLLIALLLSYLFAHYTANHLPIKHKLTTPPFVRLYYISILLWLSVGLAKSMQTPHSLLITAASLLTAWTLISAATRVFASRQLSKVIAFTLWIIAFLNITGYLTPLLDILDTTTFNVGSIKFSLLHIVKSMIVCSLIIWAALSLTRPIEKRFQRLENLTPSQKVLFSKLSNIAVYTAATLVSLNVVGLDLSTLAIFSGALGLSIGFGLQKIFSNLISGIILLLDKSVKPGDVVGVDGTYGWINSLGARYVSVLTRDGKEHLIPNETLITNRVENWSYSSSKVRIRMSIGVAYDSDLKLVKDLLLRAANSQSRILTDPAPKCLIKEFGDSSIKHELRLWINDPENGVGSLKSDIYYTIWDLFQEHNIEIPFPQREVTLKNTKPLED